MKKVLLITMLIGLVSCTKQAVIKNDCGCVEVLEIGAPLPPVHGVETWEWNIIDTLNTNCGSNGSINYIENTLRTRVICRNATNNSNI